MKKRLYALTRISAGDYVFPANDASALWRVHRYDENGDLYQVEADGSERQVVGSFWGLAKFDGTLEDADQLVKRDPEEFLDWSHWQTWESLLKTRAAAIEAAL